MQLVSMEDEYFHCESCNGELVAESDKLAAEEMGDGDDNSRRRRREKLKDMLQRMEVIENDHPFMPMEIVTYLFYVKLFMYLDFKFSYDYEVLSQVSNAETNDCREWKIFYNMT